MELPYSVCTAGHSVRPFPVAPLRTVQWAQTVVVIQIVTMTIW